jgi:inhibitor of cysteine peptidase
MPIELRAEDSGTHPSVHTGDLVTVRLPENPTTGYRWEADYDQARLRLADDRFDGASAPRGSGGERVLVFEALHPGTASIRLGKKRVWEDAPAREEFRVELQVHSQT